MAATVRDREPAKTSPSVETFQTTRLEDGRTAEVREEGELRSNASDFICELSLRLLKNGKLVRECTAKNEPRGTSCDGR